MKKIYLWVVIAMIMLSTFPVSCEKPEIKPEQEASSEQEANTSYSIVGTWVLCGITYEYNAIPGIVGQEFKDTIKFYPDGNYVYIRGDYYEDGSSFVDNHFYEYTKRYLVLYDSDYDYDYSFRYHEIAFMEDGTQLLLYDWIATPPTNIDDITNRRYRKIN